MVTKSTGRDSKELITRAAVRRLLILGGTRYCACTSFSFATGILKIMWEVRYEYIKKNGWQVECKPELLCGVMSATIGFINDKGQDDET